MLNMYKLYTDELRQEPEIIKENEFGKLVTFEKRMNSRAAIIYIGGHPEKFYPVFESKGIGGMAQYRYLGLDNFKIDISKFAPMFWLWKGEMHHKTENIALGLIDAASQIFKCYLTYCIGYARGGIIARLADQYEKFAEKIFTIGCSHLGTPMVQPEILRYYSQKSYIAKLFWEIYKGVFTGAIWDYELACCKKYPIADNEWKDNWQKTYEELKPEQRRFFTPQNLDGSFIKHLNRNGISDNVINFAGKSKKLVPGKINVDELVSAFSSKYFLKAIPGAEENDGTTPWSSLIAKGLDIKTIEYPGSVTSPEYTSNPIVCDYFIENVFNKYVV